MINKRKITLELTRKEDVLLNAIASQLKVKESAVIDMALSNLIKEVFLIDEFHVTSGPDYCELYEFEDTISFRSEMYDFLVNFYYSGECNGIIEYEVYIPYSFLNEKFGLTSNCEFDKLVNDYYNEEDPVLIKTEKGFDMENINDYLCTVRDNIEYEIVNLLEIKGLAKRLGDSE